MGVLKIMKEPYQTLSYFSLVNCSPLLNVMLEHSSFVCCQILFLSPHFFPIHILQTLFFL